jgi:hypothetical protein
MPLEVKPHDDRLDNLDAMIVDIRDRMASAIMAAGNLAKSDDHIYRHCAVERIVLLSRALGALSGMQ